MSDLVNHARQGAVNALLALSDAARDAAEDVVDSRDLAVMRHAGSPVNQAIARAQHAVLVWEATVDGALKARKGAA